MLRDYNRLSVYALPARRVAVSTCAPLLKSRIKYDKDS